MTSPVQPATQNWSSTHVSFVMSISVVNAHIVELAPLTLK